MTDWKLERILCAVDLSPASEAVLGWAALLAARSGAELHVLHAVSISAPPYITPAHYADIISGNEGLKAHAREEVAQLLAAIAPGIPARISVRDGHALLMIREQIQSTHPDLVVVGSHGHNRVERLLLGSVTENLFHEANVPVLIVKRPAPRNVEKIICPVNRNRHSERCVVAASMLTSMLGATLTVMTALGEGQPDDSACEHMSTIARGRCNVEQVAKTGTASKVILEESLAKADLIAIAAVKHRLLDAFAIGSTTEQVVRHAKTNVLVLPFEREAGGERELAAAGTFKVKG
jgi:nucleotide-binding universal stress UspA family protein